MSRIVFLLALLIFTPAAFAVQPDEMLPDPNLEARARDISKELRCLVCQNESIDDSNAELAHDLRMLVRQRLKAGDSNEQIKQYLVNRYGQYVLLKPPLETSTIALWFGPAALLVCGIVSLALFYRRPANIASTVLSADERQKLAAILGNQPIKNEDQQS